MNFGKKESKTLEFKDIDFSPNVQIMNIWFREIKIRKVCSKLPSTDLIYLKHPSYNMYA